MSRSLSALVREAFKAMLRDKMALFFTFGLPLGFLLIFGLLFNSSSSTPTVLVVGQGQLVRVIESPEMKNALKVERATDLEAARKRVQNAEVAAVISQDGDTLRVDYAGSETQTSGQVLGIVDGVVSQANLRAAGVTTPQFRMDARTVEDTSLGYIEFFVPGLLGYGISVGAVFGLAIALVQWRRSGLLRRLQLTPVATRDIALARVIVHVALAIAQTVAFFALGKLAFDLKLTGAWYMALPLVVCGTIAFLAIAFAVAAFAKTQEAASGIANAITLPMGFLGGAFFPLDQAPGWVQAISKVLPLTYLTDGLKDVMVRGQGPGAALVPMAVLLAFALVVGAFAIRVFRWE